MVLCRLGFHKYYAVRDIKRGCDGNDDLSKAVVTYKKICFRCNKTVITQETLINVDPDIPSNCWEFIWEVDMRMKDAE